MKKMIVKYGSLNKANVAQACDELMTVLEKHLGDRYEIIVIPTDGYSNIEFKD